MAYKITEEQRTSLMDYISANLVCKVGNPILNLLNQLEKIDEPEQENEE